ncbi:transposon Ty3-G Gag-Pol poly [Brachionus plicatilis]|uniref:Transposon Ty3-G Gag-Pol poly n=1 Tax=Brachionus plicatilis TaxID=10195 RepID=A0A3M7SN34_BRAPC|nr:transposon Ty3-G Gag-Pol poly [Brachionus plicatilis]
MEYCESLPVQALDHMVKAQNHLETDFHYLEENGTLVNGSEVEQADWLEKITATKAPKKLLISLLTQRAVLVAKKKEQPDANHHNKSTPLSSLSTTMEGTHQQEQIIEPDMSPMEKRDKIEEWIYLVETVAEDQGIDKNRLVTAVNKFLRGNALQLVRNLKKKKENLTWVELKSHLLATYKPDDVQRTLRSELKAIKLDVNYEENVLKFRQIANKIEKIDEFELVWMFFDAVDPRVRAELESKNVKTLDDAITHARIFSRSTWSVNKPVPVYYSRNNYKKRLKSFYNLIEKEVDRGKN